MADTILSTTGTNPPDSFFASQDGLILTVATSDLGNADTSYTYFGLVNSGFNAFTLDFVITATTLTLETTQDAASVANADATWRDVTLTLTSGASSSFTATGILTMYAPVEYSRMRIKRVTTNATNALQLRLTRMRIR